MAMQSTVIAQGKLRGVPMEGYTVFKGVPYAQPPVGALRFQPPKAPSAWEGIRVCDTFPRACWQNDQPMGSFYQKEFHDKPERFSEKSEDCLYLNIWTPAETEGAKLPVAVWIHGGAFDHGFGHEVEFDGAGFAKHGVVLVTINYRVGVFGYFAHPWLNERSGNGVSGNCGLLDQLTALRWVKENIGAFGGDADKITVFGQSAGSMSVQAIVSSPLSKGLLHGAILQSGGGYRSSLNRDTTLAQACEMGTEFTTRYGLDTYDALLNADPADLLRWQTDYQHTCVLGMPFRPCIDGLVLPEGFNACAEAGHTQNIAYMLGSTLDDIGETKELHAQGRRGFLRGSCIAWSLLQEKLGRKPAYVYDFVHALPGDDAGAFHSSEIWYVFGSLGNSWRPFTDADYALSSRMMDDWVGFMRDGHPSYAPCTAADPHVETYDI